MLHYAAGGSSRAQNTPTRCGNSLHTRAAQVLCGALALSYKECKGDVAAPTVDAQGGPGKPAQAGSSFSWEGLLRST